MGDAKHKNFFVKNNEEQQQNNKMNMNMIEKIMLDQASSVGDENDEIGPLQSKNMLSPIVPLGKYSRSSGTAEMSRTSRRSGKSFITIKDESKQIEVSSTAFEDDDEDEDTFSDESDDGDDFDEDDVSNRKYSDYMKNRIKHKNGRKMISVPSESNISSVSFKHITAYSQDIESLEFIEDNASHTVDDNDHNDDG